MQRPVRGRRGRRAALAAVVTLAAVLLAVLFARRGGLKEGPVYAGGGRNAQAIDVGVPYSFGYLLRTEGKRPAELERVRVLGVTGPIEVLGVMARPHPSGPKPYFFALAFGFPPPDYPSKPLAEEHVVPLGSTFSEGGTPDQGLQLVVGVKSTGPGIGRIHGIEFTYRVGKRRYRNSYDGSGFLCAPSSEYLQGAPKSEECLDPRTTYTWDKKFVDFKVAAQNKT
jgi:hypothetical protein